MTTKVCFWCELVCVSLAPTSSVFSHAWPVPELRVQGLMHLVVFGIHDQAVRTFDVFVREIEKAIRAGNERSVAGRLERELASSSLTSSSFPW